MDGTKALFFRNWGHTNATPSITGADVIDQYNVANATANSVVWDISSCLNPVLIHTNFNSGNNTLIFQNLADSLHEYVAFDRTNVASPTILGKIANQDLHQVGSGADFLIITHPSLVSEAKRLANFHQVQDGYQTVVAQTPQIYQEFASGNPDPAAIRDFVKMYYDQAQKTGGKKPRFLLLFGEGSYDPKNRVPGNINLVPVYETVNSLDPLVSHVSDDFFGLLSDADDINLVSPAGLLDIGIGRIPAHSIDEAKIMVDKIIHYSDTASLGSWRTKTVYIADDKDQNLHLNDAESLVQTVSMANPSLHADKIYLDAYPLVSGNVGTPSKDLSWATSFMKKKVDPKLLKLWKKLYMKASIRGYQYAYETVRDLIKRFGKDQMIILISDHGQSLNEHGYIGHGVMLTDESVRVPFAVMMPKGFEEAPFTIR